MCIGTDRNDPATQLVISFYDVDAGIGRADTTAETAGIDLKSFIVFDQEPQDFINDLTIIRIAVVPVPGRTVADNIIQMPLHVKIGKFLYVFKL